MDEITCRGTASSAHPVSDVRDVLWETYPSPPPKTPSASSPRTHPATAAKRPTRTPSEAPRRAARGRRGFTLPLLPAFAAKSRADQFRDDRHETGGATPGAHRRDLRIAHLRAGAAQSASDDL